jgi:hypothetical protein
MSHATSSLQQCTFKAGCGDLKAFFNIVPVGSRAYWVVCSNVFCMMSADIHPKKGRKSLKSGERLTVVLGIIACAEVGGFCYLMLKGVIENVTLMVFGSGEHMGGINTLINDVISSSTMRNTCYGGV